MLLDGFFLAIECSLKYLLENTGIYWLTWMRAIECSVPFPKMLWMLCESYVVK